MATKGKPMGMKPGKGKGSMMSGMPDPMASMKKFGSSIMKKGKKGK